ncbi:hypothetical protein CWI38_1603p0010 [Hamiltosporidium tvaerminnensis]|uniref:Uncharacterized protein n=1 Tax=Hamiltosporidium tvaerminnensis TaxID=1176355 RepID=A0A4Q9LQ93_9MICR|nr:hypothetical protein CWI38_1603p0010 [Hamiltosporidium tvaerminnensis]
MLFFRRCLSFGTEELGKLCQSLIETRQPNDFSKALVKKKEFKKFNKKSLICLKEGQIEKRITLTKEDKKVEHLATCCKKIQGYTYIRNNIESQPTPNLSK